MPLHQAVSKGHTDVVSFLLERGADIEAKDMVIDSN
jgi:ankyrin repeat protein